MNNKINNGKEFIMKKIISSILIAILLMSVAIIPGYSFDEQYVYVAPDGEKIYYYLDENLNPYNYIGDDKVYLALPLEHLRVTDPAILAELNSSIETASVNSVPSTYYDISTGGASTASPHYTKSVSFESASSFTTPVLKLNTSHTTMRVKASNIVKKNIFAGKKFDVTHYYYSVTDDSWFNQADTGIDLSSTYPILYTPDVYNFSKIKITKNSAIKTFTLDVWTTPLW
jgi:hypothetical protein